MVKLKIFLSYKDKHELIKSDILQPIQTGRALASEIFESMLGDDTGDNISRHNSKYNELSAQYWVWKHYEEIGSPEYVGFMHYRRHFVFNESLDYRNNKPWFYGMNIFKVKNFTHEFKDNLSSKYILPLIEQNFDCYVLKSYNTQLQNFNDIYMKEHYLSSIPGSKRYIWDEFSNIINTQFPEYSFFLEKFTYNSYLNPCNMFIMKKELFMEYSRFCFTVLNQLDNKIDSSKFSPQELRFLGYLGEYLLTIFVIKLESDKYKLKYLDGLLFVNIDDNISLLQILHKLFSIKNTTNHLIINCFGISLKIRKYSSITKHLRKQDEMLQILTNKVTELQEQIILKNKG